MSEIDDAEALVKEVLAENPPEDRGVREEWNHQVGWHRKENIYGGLRGKNAARSAENTKLHDRAASPAPLSLEKGSRISQSSAGESMVYHPIWIVLLFGLLFLLWRIGVMGNSKKKRLA